MFCLHCPVLSQDATASPALTPCVVLPQIVIFDNLTPVQLREIVRHMAEEIGTRLRSRNITLIMTDRALDAVVHIVRTPPTGSMVCGPG